MPKTIIIPNTDPLPFRGDVRVDVDAFVAFAERSRREPLTSIPTRWAVASLFSFDGHGHVVITPRGEDLLASAHLIPEDPPPPEPERPKCKECDGKGRFLSFIKYIDCEACEGTGVAAPCSSLASLVQHFDERQSPNDLIRIESHRTCSAYNSPYQSAAAADNSTQFVAELKALGQQMQERGLVVHYPEVPRSGEADVDLRESTWVAWRRDLPTFDELPKQFTRDTRGRLRIGFGRHASKRLDRVPTPYLKWMLTAGFPVGVDVIVQTELAERGEVG